MGTFKPGVPVAVAIAPAPGAVLTPVGVDKPLNVTLPLGVTSGGPAQEGAVYSHNIHTTFT